MIKTLLGRGAEQEKPKSHYELLTTGSVGKAVRRIKEAFEKKRKLERLIAKLIREYEDESGLIIDMIKYQRDITLPSRGSQYTDLTIIVSSEEFKEENGEPKN